MNRFSLVGLTGMFTWNTYTGLVILVSWICPFPFDKNSYSQFHSSASCLQVQ